MSQPACRHCGRPLTVATPDGLCPICAHPASDPLRSDSTPQLAAGGEGGPSPTPACAPPTALWAPSGTADPDSASEAPTAAERTPADDEADALRQLAPPQGPDELGRLGQYRILKVLGIGGMGVVYQAEDAILGRAVALKAMLPAVAARAANRQRFVREAKATAALRHEHIVTVFHVGEDRGVPYLVMEFLEGETLEDRLKREKQLPVDAVLRIGLQTARGLAAAHARGLVHRDIKPANIWLERGTGRVKILDFGLARATADDTHLTVSGIILGTPAYMAPEQARGEPVDARTDLFSLGAVLYRLCTGRLPFRGKDTLAILAALAVDTPESIAHVRGGLPAALEHLVMRLLAKTPEDRPTDAATVCEALERIQREESGEPVLVFDPTEVKFEDEPAEPDEPVAPVGPLPALTPDLMGGLTGRTLGRYTLGEVIGHGQHGVTFRGHDDSGPVALKVLSCEFPASDAEVVRFSQVMTRWLPLRHPNLVTVSNAGRTGPYCWLAQELVEGENLNAVLRRLDPGCGWEWKRVYRAAVHLGRALEALRAARVVHSNVTPQNVLVRQGDGVFKLNDALFARLLQKSQLHQLRLDAKLEAEVPYLSPEQADGGTSFVDHLCDLYSLGAVLYALVTGHPPYQGRTFEETLELIRGGDLTRPRKLQRSLPREFDWVIVKMLARRQEERYQSPTELIAELNRIGIQYRIAV